MGKLYYTIGEVAAMLGENTSTLRYWEKEFDMLHPSRNSRGNRRYADADLELLKRICQLTRQEGYTIEGARYQLSQERNVPDPKATREQLTRALQHIRETLADLYEQLGPEDQ